MKVKIGNKIYDAERQPIMFIMTDIERYKLIENLNKMVEMDADSIRKYCVFPSGIKEDEIKKFMKI